MALDLMMGVKTTKNLTLDFTDLADAGSGARLPTDYHGYSISQGAPNNPLYLLNGQTYRASGYHNAAVSANQTNVGYNGYAQFPIDIHKTNNGTFTFTGLTFESAWNSSETVTISGYKNGVVVPGDIKTVTVDDVHLTSVKVNWTNVDDVKITLVGSIHDPSASGVGDHLVIASIGVSI